MTNPENVENNGSNPIFKSFFSALVEAASKAHLKNQERISQRSNLQVLQEDGIINLTETKSGLFVWMPNAKAHGTCISTN